jgi:hypothetical protein
MADTFSQIYVQTIFAVQDHIALIQPTWEVELYKFNNGQKFRTLLSKNA